MAEVNIGGITFKGGKMLAVILALGSSIGVLYGGFEAYKKFQDMSAQIESYVAPDLSEFDKTIALTKEEMRFNDKVARFRNSLPDILVAPFNSNQWSQI